MSIPFLNNIDLNNNEVQNFLVQKLSSAPTAVEAMMYYNTTSDKFYGYNGTAWVDLSSGGTGDVVGPASATDENLVVFDGITGKLIKDSSVSLSALSTALGYIDQNVTSGSSPTFDGANITGIDADNVDIADTGELYTATDVEGALAEVKTQANALPQIYATDIGNGTDVALVVTHSLGTRDVIVQVRDNSSPYDYIGIESEATTTDTVTIRFTVAPTSNQYRCIVIG
jgi:hypothetical protein